MECCKLEEKDLQMNPLIQDQNHKSSKDESGPDLNKEYFLV